MKRNSLPQLSLGKLSKGERLYLERRRRGESTTEAAARYGVGRNKFANWERERDAVSDAPSVSLKSEPKPHEACQILRRRAGLEISELAEQVGVSRYWLRQMESGQVSVSRLVQHWAGRQRPWKRSEALAQQTA